MKSFKTIFLICIFAYGSQFEIDSSRENAITKAISIASPAVASINVTQVQRFVVNPYFDDPWFDLFFSPEIRQREVKGSGSGVVISPDGYVLTNDHVVENADKIIVTLPGGTEYDAEIIGFDNVTDLALLKLDGENFPFIKIGDSDRLIIGEWAIAMGNPFGLFDINQQPTATIGIISGKNLDFGNQDGKIFQDMIQTDAAINPGNSGGPLLNSKGQLIGINTFIFTGGKSKQGSIGIGFAIPAKRAIKIAEELKAKGRIVRSFTTGLLVQPLDSKTISYLNTPFRKGVVIVQIEKNSPADNARLEYLDVIVEAEGERVSNRQDLLDIIKLNDLRSGDRIKLRIWRDGKFLNRTLALGKI